MFGFLGPGRTMIQAKEPFMLEIMSEYRVPPETTLEDLANDKPVLLVFLRHLG